MRRIDKMRRNRFTIVFFYFVLAFTLLVGCKTKEKMVYFQGGSAPIVSQQSNYTPVFKSDDFLSVVITSSNPESVIPFNYPKELVAGSAGGNAGYSLGRPVPSGFLVDGDGFVDLPIIGKILVAGKSRTEVINELLFIYKDYLKDPVVHIQIQNYKVTVLGEVLNPGTFQIPNERITVLEAIGLASDLKITGVRNNVLVIRDRNGVKQQFRIDLTSNDILSSPVYYLEQNDVVYVEPNLASRLQGTMLRTGSTIAFSAISVVLSVLIFFRN